MELPVHHGEVAEFLSLCSLLRDSYRPQSFAYPAFDEHSDEHSEKHDPGTSVEESIDDSRGEKSARIYGPRLELRIIWVW